MARTARVKRTGKGIANYHLMSRANDRQFLFDGPAIKDKIIDSLRRAAEFSGVRPRSYTTLDNHFHIVVKVDRTQGPVPEAEVIRRVGVLHGEVGQTLKTGEVNGKIGTGEIVAIEGGRVTVRVCHDRESLKPWVDLVLAPPRPRVMKRLLPQLATMGVGRIFLVGAKKVEKDFWGATLLKPENYLYAISDTTELRQAVADWYARRYEVKLDPTTEICSLLGSQDGLGHIALSLLDEGDTMLVPDPCYPVFADGPKLAGVRLVYMPMKRENKYLIDFAAIDEEDARKAKFMLVSYPNNPTAATAPLAIQPAKKAPQQKAKKEYTGPKVEGEDWDD